MKEFPTQRTDARQIFPYPAEGARVEETPPCFSWLMTDGENTYRITVKNAEGAIVWQGETNKNSIVPDRVFPAGEYLWNIETEESARGWQTFSVSDKAVIFLRPAADQVFNSVPAKRPRHLFYREDIAKIRAEKGPELETLKRNIKQAYSDGMPDRPMFHRNESAFPYREYFGRYRDYCDRNLVACALGYVLLDDDKAGNFARELFLDICDMSPAGPCSLLGPWGDEVGLSNARCLPAVYDLLYPLFSDKERVFAEHTIEAYALQCERRLDSLNYCLNPGDSHAGRLPAYLGDAALVLKGGCVPEDELKRWLAKALEIFGGIFPYFGGIDGGWAEGSFYSTSYTKWYLPFFSAVERFSGYSFLDRPFYQRYSQFLIHFVNPDNEIHPFGDGYWCDPESTEWPGFFAQNPYRVYGTRFGLQLAVQRAKKLAAPELFKLHLLDIFLPEGKAPAVRLTGRESDIQAFPETGFVSLHSNLNNTENDLQLIARASKYGPNSHRHADQGSFALFYNGTALISPSGYFGRAYGTAHHRLWLNCTRAHNALLIDGEGQPYGDFRMTGEILFCGIENNMKTVIFDLSNSYPMLRTWTRRFVMTDSRHITITDHVEASHPVSVTYPLHTLSEPKKEGNIVRITRNHITLTVTPTEGELEKCEISDKFAVDLNEGVPQAFHVSMPQQYHISWQTGKKAVHDITVTYEVITA